MPNFIPKKSIGDFEKSSMRAFQENFCSIENQGCYFHFRQANLKKIGKLNLRNFYLKNAYANQWFNLVMGCGFLPERNVLEFFDK